MSNSEAVSQTTSTSPSPARASKRASSTATGVIVPSTTERSQRGPRLSLRRKVALDQAGVNAARVPMSVPSGGFGIGGAFVFSVGLAPPPR